MADEKATAAEPFRLQFHYIKGPTYREIAAHGVIGGVTPQGKVWMALYTERGPLPRMVEYHVPPAGEGVTSIQFDELAKVPDFIDSRQGVIRHVEVSTYMDIDFAERFHQWLGTQIEQIKGQEKK
jgi:hypothetical protein